MKMLTWLIRFWNYVLVGGLGSAGVATIQPALTVVNYAVSTALCVTSLAWYVQ